MAIAVTLPVTQPTSLKYERQQVMRRMQDNEPGHPTRRYVTQTQQIMTWSSNILAEINLATNRVIATSETETYRKWPHLASTYQLRLPASTYQLALTT